MGERMVGCAVGALRNGPATGRLAAIRHFGIGWIEPQFDVDALDADDEAFMSSVRNELAEAELSVWSVHSPFGPEVDISSPDGAVRDRGVKAIKRAAKGAAIFGARAMVVHCGDICEDGDHPERLEKALNSLNLILETCAPLGVKIALENLPPQRLTCDADELMSVVDRFPSDRVGVCLDTGHANIAGTLLPLIKRVAPRIATVHLHDNDGTGDQHLVPGGGTIDWIAVREALKASPYSGPLMFEVDRPGAYADMMVEVAKAAQLLSA